VKKLLIIEDNPDVLANLLLILEMEGFEVASVSTGRESILHARAHSPDLILSDISLPDLSGLEILRKLREDSRTTTIPVIVMTAYSDPQLHQDCLAAGALRIFEKPPDIEELIDTIHRAT